jgi:hypothetical protein
LNYDVALRGHTIIRRATTCPDASAPPGRRTILPVRLALTDHAICFKLFIKRRITADVLPVRAHIDVALPTPCEQKRYSYGYDTQHEFPTISMREFINTSRIEGIGEA